MRLFFALWLVRGFAPVSSNLQGLGARYEVLAKWPLEGAVFD